MLKAAAVASVTLTSGGSDYTSAPAVRFSGGGGSGATATARLAPRPAPPEPPAGWRRLRPGSDADTTSVTVDLTTGEARAVNDAAPPVEWTILLRARDRNGHAGGIARTTVAAAGTPVPAAWLGVKAVLLWTLRGRTLRRCPRHRRRTRR